MAKKTTTATTVDTNPASEIAENQTAPQAPVQHAAPKVWVIVDGVRREVEISVEEAPELVKTLSTDPAVIAKREADRKAEIAAKAKAKRDEEKNKRMQDPEFLAKLEARKLKASQNSALKAKRDENRQRREDKRKAELEQKLAFLTESGSSLPIERLLEAKITKKYAHGMKEEGVQRGWSWKVVYISKSKKTVTVDGVIDLDKEGVGTLDSAHADAKKAICDTLSEVA